MGRKKRAITRAMIAKAEKLAGLAFTESERRLMLDGVNENLVELYSNY